MDTQAAVESQAQLGPVEIQEGILAVKDTLGTPVVRLEMDTWDLQVTQDLQDPVEALVTPDLEVTTEIQVMPVVQLGVHPAILAAWWWDTLDQRLPMEELG